MSSSQRRVGGKFRPGLSSGPVVVLVRNGDSDWKRVTRALSSEGRGKDAFGCYCVWNRVAGEES